jgi:perosamine synthetase
MEKIPYHKPFPLSETDLGNLQFDIKEILISGKLTSGDYVKKLEDRIKELYDVDYVIATSNCTMGLALCFQYKNIPNKVFMPNFTWISPYLMMSCREKGFLDINKLTWNISDYPAHRHNLIFPTHTFGNVVELSRNYNVIYDGAHALGSDIKKFGDATVFSLAPTKLVTSCEGGLVLTNEKYLESFVRFRREKCARMSEIHALIGLKTLDYLDVILEWKQRVYHYYKSYIPGIFQEINIDSNYNTIGFLNTENLKIPKWITTKQYYEPVFDMELLPNSFEVFKKMVCLPSYYNCPYKDIVEGILEMNGL